MVGETIVSASDTVGVRAEPGCLPETSGRAAVFFANLTSLFFGNRLATDALRQMLAGTLTSYGGRLVPVLDLLFRDPGGHGNLLIVDRPPDPELLSYQGVQLGLKLPEIAIAGAEDYESADVIGRIAAHPALWLDGFVTDQQLGRVAAKAGKRCFSTPEGSMLANNKMELHEELLRLGLPVFDTEIAKGPGDIATCCARLREKGYRSAAVKAQIGASGIGIVKVDTRDPDRLSDLMFYDGACLVQGWVEQGINAVRHVHSPSVQVFVGERGVSLYDITDQILDHQSVHEGNIAPPYARGSLSSEGRLLLEQAEPVARWLHSTSYRGPASIDFHVAVRGESVEVRACEINARVTGATYPSLLARHFQRHGAWLMRNLALPDAMSAGDLLELLARSGGLYSPGDSSGCIPVNFNIDPEGRVVKGQFLFLGSGVEEVAAQLGELVALPEIDLHYDRD